MLRNDRIRNYITRFAVALMRCANTPKCQWGGMSCMIRTRCPDAYPSSSAIILTPSASHDDRWNDVSLFPVQAVAWRSREEPTGALQLSHNRRRKRYRGGKRRGNMKIKRKIYNREWKRESRSRRKRGRQNVLVARGSIKSNQLR